VSPDAVGVATWFGVSLLSLRSLPYRSLRKSIYFLLPNHERALVRPFVTYVSLFPLPSVYPYAALCENLEPLLLVRGFENANLLAVILRYAHGPAANASILPPVKGDAAETARVGFRRYFMHMALSPHGILFALSFVGIMRT
jgi:hypothetical protein